MSLACIFSMTQRLTKPKPLQSAPFFSYFKAAWYHTTLHSSHEFFRDAETTAKIPEKSSAKNIWVPLHLLSSLPISMDLLCSACTPEILKSIKMEFSLFDSIVCGVYVAMFVLFPFIIPVQCNWYLLLSRFCRTQCILTFLFQFAKNIL